ncbi:MAG: Cell shape-determining protein MreC [Parcubacteria group bacterium GW2011_GWA1_38_7]|nr:MAG: Cell shape-determining protein MreC [Parcubacteria group bacterium GW2011_GWA1_38_7]
MTFQIKHTKHSSFGRNFLKILTIFLLILIFVLVFNFSISARSLALDFFTVFLKGGDYFYKNIGQVSKVFSSKDKLIEENKDLRDKVEKDYLDLIDYESIKYENQKLRETLKIKPAENFIVASIIARSPQIPMDSLFLDKGISDGVKEGDLVLIGERVLIGKIVETSKNKSIASLTSFADLVSYGFVDRTEESLEIKGTGGGSMGMKVPIDFDIIVGDKIMLSGVFTYLAAVVGIVEEDQSSGFKNILMSLPVSISKINMVFIEPRINE